MSSFIYSIFCVIKAPEKHIIEFYFLEHTLATNYLSILFLHMINKVVFLRTMATTVKISSCVVWRINDNKISRCTITHVNDDKTETTNGVRS